MMDNLEKLDYLTHLTNNRAKRLKMFRKLKAPAQIIEQEKKLLLEAVTQLTEHLSAWMLEDVEPVTKGNIDSDSIFDDPCTCTPDSQPCPSCVRKSQSEHGDEIPF